VREGFPDFRRQALGIIAQGDMVIAITNSTGTNTGHFFTLPPTGNKVSWESVHIFRIGEDGKIAKHTVIRSGPAFWAQLGVIGPALPKYEPSFRALVGGVTNSSR
jgi:nogalonic acid methyl ester cyclase / aklanonic acid methyl ester cyclase